MASPVQPSHVVAVPRGHLAPGELAVRAALLAMLLSLLLPVSPSAAQEISVTRLESDGTAAGDAAAYSRATFTAGAADTVLIARDDEFADALASGPVQQLIGAPLLLTGTDQLPAVTSEEITRLGAGRAVLIGGARAVSPAVESALADMGVAIERLSGATRLDTAVLVQRRFFPTATDVVLVRAFGDADDPTRAFADTIPVGAYGAIAATPILLTASDELSGPTAEALDSGVVERVTVVGGTDAVSEDVAAQVDAIENGSSDDDPGITVRRVSGPTRYATAVALAADLGFPSAADTRRVILVEGQSPTAWTGGLPAAIQAGNDAPVVLANGDKLLAPTFEYLFDAGVPLLCAPNTTATACEKAAEALAGRGQADAGGGADALTVTPTEAREASLPAEDPLGLGLSVPDGTGDDLTYTATGLDPAQAYRITLVVADDVTVEGDGGARFTDADGDGIADPGPSEEVALITEVNGEPVEGGGAKTVPDGSDDPQQPTAVFPAADGTIELTIDGEGPGSVRPVVYVNAGASTFLEVDADGRPVEAFGVGGEATYS